MVFEVAQMLVGTALCCFSVACFALPYNMVVSGVSGIGRVVNLTMGVNVTITVAVVNIIFFILGAIFLGKKFAAATALGTFAFPFFLGIFQNIEALSHLVDDPLLAAIVAGLLDGVGLGMVIRVGGSTGGIDIPSILLNKKMGWQTGTVMSAIDITIFLIQIPVTDTNGIILGILYAIIYSLVMNRIIMMGQGGMQLMIWTPEAHRVNERLLQLGFGTTLLKGRGGYLREDCEVIYCATSNRNLIKAKNAALEIDSKAFITLTSMNEVNGNGFTWMASDEDYVPAVSDRRSGLEISGANEEEDGKKL